MGTCFVTCKKKTLPLCAGIIVDGVLPKDLAPHGVARPVGRALRSACPYGRGSEKEEFALVGVAWGQNNTLMRANASSALTVCPTHF